jgi:hypothetical protein
MIVAIIATQGHGIADRTKTGPRASAQRRRNLANGGAGLRVAAVRWTSPKTRGEHGSKSRCQEGSVGGVGKFAGDRERAATF